MSPAWTYGPWQKVYHCNGCERELTPHQVTGSSGVCPLCGYFSRFDPDVCSVTAVAARKVTTVKASWWGRLFGVKEEWHWEYRDQ